VGKGQRYGFVAFLAFAGLSFASCGGSTPIPTGTIDGVALGTCGPSPSEKFAYVGRATADVLQDGRLVKTVPVGLGEGFRVPLKPGAYLIKYQADPKYPQLAGPSVHVVVVSGRATRATISPRCSGSTATGFLTNTKWQRKERSPSQGRPATELPHRPGSVLGQSGAG
jgi:hypothetical protein